jgi:DNA (cytosine-5)-methyltransferase 1
LIVPVTQFGDTAGTLTARHDSSPCADRGMNVVAQPIAFHPTQDPISSTDGTTHGLGCGSSGGQASVAVAQPMPINTMVALRHEALGEGTGFGIGAAGDPAYTLTKGHSHAVAQPYTLAIRGRGDCHNLEYRQDGTANALLTPNGGRGGIGVGAVAQPIGWSEELTASVDLAGTIQRGGAGGRHDGVMQTNMAVRRLTPVECERLQGFPDAYTNIPWRNKPESPDGPRYKALGNSWAVPNVRWIGQRIASALR